MFVCVVVFLCVDMKNVNICSQLFHINVYLKPQFIGQNCYHLYRFQKRLKCINLSFKAVQYNIHIYLLYYALIYTKKKSTFCLLDTQHHKTLILKPPYFPSIN